MIKEQNSTETLRWSAIVIPRNKVTFLDIVVFNRERLKDKSILDLKTHYKLSETFQ